MQRDHFTGRNHADDGRRAPRTDHAERLLGGGLEADGFEGIVHAAAGDLPDLGDGIPVGGVDHIGGAEVAGQLQLRRHLVHRDDPGRAGEGRSVDARQADAAATDHGDGGTGFHVGGVDDGTDARGDPAADQGRTIQGHVFADLHEGVLVDQHLLGEGAEVGELAEFRAFLGQPRLVGGTPPDFGFLAERHVSRQAVFAMAAEHGQAGDDVVAGLDVANRGTDLLDDPRRLVAEDAGHGAGIGAVEEVHVRVTDASRRRADQHLPRAGLVDLDLFDIHPGIHGAEDGCFHRFLCWVGDGQCAKG